jgi:hypothetical protein
LNGLGGWKGDGFSGGSVLFELGLRSVERDFVVLKAFSVGIEFWGASFGCLFSRGIFGDSPVLVFCIDFPRN